MCKESYSIINNYIALFFKNDTYLGQNIHHRTDGPAIECFGIFKSWYINGQRHREGGPAYECLNGNKEWYIHGKLHREDGPAIERANGDKEWYINGIKYSEEEYYRLINLKSFM